MTGQMLSLMSCPSLFHDYDRQFQRELGMTHIPVHVAESSASHARHGYAATKLSPTRLCNDLEQPQKNETSDPISPYAPGVVLS